VGCNITASAAESVYILKPSITLNKSSNFTSGDKCLINYSINITNNGTVTFDPVSLVDYLPSGVQYLSSTGGGVLSGSTVNWASVGPLNSGQTKIFYILARINYTAEGLLANRANVTATYAGTPSYAQDWENFTAHAVDIKVKKGASPKQAVYMQNVVFTINVTNTGNTALNPVTVVDNLPAGLTYISDNQTPMATVAGNTVTWANIGSLAPGAYKNISLVTQANGATTGWLTNSVLATGDPGVGCNITNASTEKVYILQPKIAVDKSSDFATGDKCNINYSINVTNTGEAPLDPVSLTDTLPAGQCSYAQCRPD
jgi:uncharacterized repeat protein (TIGR01451 family)